MSNPSFEETLAHFGVKGMKWGVRKDFKEAQKNFNSVSYEVNQRQTERRGNASISESQYKQLSRQDFVVEKGSVLKRTTNDPNLSGPTFVSTNEKDAAVYRALLPTGPQGGFVTKKQEGYYETTLLATERLKSPSEKVRVDAYIRLMDVPEVRLTTGEVITGREVMRRAGLGDVVDTLSSKQLALTYYGQLAVNQGIKDEPLSTAYFNSLKKKGYNTLIDDNDRKILSDEPLLVFDSTKSLSTISVKQLSSKDVFEAQKTMTLPRR